MDPDGDPDRQQNLITWSLGHAPLRYFVTIRSQRFQLSDGQTDKQTEVMLSPSEEVT